MSRFTLPAFTMFNAGKSGEPYNHLPYFVHQLSTWKRQMLRERDFLEADGLDLLG